MLAVSTAKARGFRVEEALLRRQIDEVAKRGNVNRILEGGGGLNPSANLGYFMIGLSAAGVGRNPMTAAVAEQYRRLQAADGRWVSTSHRPPHEDSMHTATALGIFTLRVYGDDRDAERIRRAAQWLSKAPSAEFDNDIWRLVGLVWANADRGEIDRAEAKVRAQQLPSGGYRQLPLRNSDVYATAFATLALRLAGARGSDPAVLRAEAYLREYQQADGSWRVRTRRVWPGLPHFETGYPYGADQFISYAGAAFATTVLAASGTDGAPLQFQARPAPPGPGLEAAFYAKDPRTQDLFAAAALGSIAAVRSELDRGADPNATNADGTTILAFSAGNPSIVRLLLDRGANPNAVGTSGVYPLSIAARSHDGRESVRMLLRAGAQANRVPKRFVSPLSQSVVSLDMPRLEMLLAAGATVDTQREFFDRPIAIAAYMPNIAALNRLIPEASHIDSVNADGEGYLSDAVIFNFPDVAEILLKSGADPNRRGIDKMTRLHYAAKSNYGDGRIAEMLLANGADPDARDAKGRTPSQVAREYGNTAVLQVLARVERNR